MLPEVEAAWKLARLRDARRGYIIDRDLDTYLTWLGGLGVFLEHARRVAASDVVVDVGAGEALAINQLSQLPGYSDRLQFVACGLTNPRTYDPYSENKLPYVTTGAEVMDGVARSAGLLAVASITYSVRPDMVVDAYARSLVPGGVAKAAFPHADNTALYPSGAGAYESCFKSAGFDVQHGESSNGAHLVVAVAPGGQPPFGAKEVLVRDAATEAFMRRALHEFESQMAD